MDQEAAVSQQIVEEVQRLQRIAEKRRTKRIDKVAAQLENKSPFIDFRSVRLTIPPKPVTGFSQRQWDSIEGQIVELFKANEVLVVEPTCLLDYYLGVITTTHPDLFEARYFGYKHLKTGVQGKLKCERERIQKKRKLEELAEQNVRQRQMQPNGSNYSGAQPGPRLQSGDRSDLANESALENFNSQSMTAPGLLSIGPPPAQNPTEVLPVPLLAANSPAAHLGGNSSGGVDALIDEESNDMLGAINELQNSETRVTSIGTRSSATRRTANVIMNGLGDSFTGALRDLTNESNATAPQPKATRGRKKGSKNKN